MKKGGKDMRSFAETWPNIVFMQQGAAQIPWKNLLQ